MRGVEFASIAAVMVLVAVVFEFVPRLRKRNIYFGVTVDPAFRETAEARAIAARFRLVLWGGTAVSILGAWLAVESSARLAAGLSPLLQLAFVIGAWIWGWSATRPHAAQPFGERSAELYSSADPLPGGPLLIWLPFLGPAAATLWLAAAWDELPARYPAHYGISGQADRWVEKTAAAVFFSPAMSFLALALMAAVTFMIRHGARRGSSGERAGWAARYRSLNVKMLVAVMWAMSALTSVISVGPLVPPEVLSWTLPIATLCLLGGIAGFAVPLIRMSMEATGGSDATPDECWKLGLFYVNPNDPALMVEKRDGIGYTLNFGNRLTWGLIVLIVLIVFVPLYFARAMRGA